MAKKGQNGGLIDLKDRLRMEWTVQGNETRPGLGVSRLERAIQIISDRLSALVTLVSGQEQEIHLPPMRSQSSRG